MSHPPGTISDLLHDWRDGDEKAIHKLVPLVERELRRLARLYVRKQRPGSESLQTTELINEAYLRLVDHKGMRWQNRAHFYAVAAQAMRRILVDRARAHFADKRGGRAIRVSLDDGANLADERAKELLALEEALIDLAKLDERKSRIVELRYFGGLTVEETADVLRISPVTVMREWRSAKGWLLRAIS